MGKTEKQEILEEKKSTEKQEVSEETKPNEKTYIYLGKNITEDGFIIKYKSLYSEEQMKKIKKMKNYKEYKENFIDLEEYSKNY